jgi:hypothetical protein
MVRVLALMVLAACVEATSSSQRASVRADDGSHSPDGRAYHGVGYRTFNFTFAGRGIDPSVLANEAMPVVRSMHPALPGEVPPWIKKPPRPNVRVLPMG